MKSAVHVYIIIKGAICGERLEGLDCGAAAAEWLEDALGRPGLRYSLPRIKHAFLNITRYCVHMHSFSISVLCMAEKLRWVPKGSRKKNKNPPLMARPLRVGWGG